MTYANLSLWLEQAQPIVPRAPLSGDASADVVIVGGGFTGLWTAYYLKKKQPDLAVTILERSVAGAGASGRNGGVVLGDFGSPEVYLRGHSREQVLAQIRAARTSPDEIGRVIAEEGIDCEYVKSGSLQIARNPYQEQRLRDHQRYLESWALSEGADARWLSADEAAKMINIPGVLGGTFDPGVGRVQPAKLVRGLAETVEKLGAAICEQTTVTHIENGRVLTSSGTVRARTIIRATEGYSEGLPGADRRVLAFTSQIVATEPLPAELWKQIGWDYRGALTDMSRLFVFAVRTADDRIALGGRKTYRPVRPAEPGVEPRILVRENFALIEQALRELFPAAAYAAITHRWGGIWGVTRDFSPRIVFDQAAGFGWAGGYGSGVGASNLAGRTLSDLILGRETTLTRLPWVTSRARRWPPDPLPGIGTQLITRVLEHADRRESVGLPAPSYTSAVERLLPH